MKKLLIAIFITCAGSAGAAQPSKDDGCAANVTGSIQALETMQDKSGKTESLSGLTIAEIKKIAAERGVCAASQAINDRLYAQPLKQ